MTIRIGDIVVSTYRARWTGVVLGRACDMTPPLSTYAHVMVVRMIRDRNGNPPRKPMSARHVHVLDQAYLRNVAP